MRSQLSARFCLLLAAMLAMAPLLDAQKRGGRKGAGRGGGKARGGLFLPKPLAPVQVRKPKLKPKAGRKLPDSLLPDATAPALAGSVPGTDISQFAERSVVFWTDPLDPELEAYYFELCDHDQNEWISYRESAFSLDLTRSQFAYYDSDRDGRIQRAEFGERYSLVVERAGKFPPPRPKITASLEDVETSKEDGEDDPLAKSEEQQLLERFDSNESLALELGELPPLIDFWRLTGHVTPEQLMKAIDGGATSALELEEMTPLISGLALAQHRFLGNVISIETLFELSITPRNKVSERPPAPTIDRRSGPTSHFARLDQDGDGFIDATDLGILQSPMHLSVRTNAVVAALDADGDGRISETEFLGSFE